MNRVLVIYQCAHGSTQCTYRVTHACIGHWFGILYYSHAHTHAQTHAGARVRWKLSHSISSIRFQYCGSCCFCCRNFFSSSLILCTFYVLFFYLISFHFIFQMQRDFTYLSMRLKRYFMDCFQQQKLMDHLFLIFCGSNYLTVPQTEWIWSKELDLFNKLLLLNSFGLLLNMFCVHSHR